MLGIGSVRMAGWCSDEVMGDGGLRVESEERCCILNEGTRCSGRGDLDFGFPRELDVARMGCSHNGHNLF